jgi:large subunit ribosomal protein L25
MDIGDSVHLSELVMPQGVTLLAIAQDPEHDQPLVSIQHSQKFDEEEEALLAEGEELEEGAPEADGEAPAQAPEEGEDS